MGGNPHCQSLMEKDTKVRVASRLEQIAAITTYCAVGPALIFLNRHLMVEKQFKYPASLTAGGLLACWIFSHAAVFSGCYKLKHRETVDAKFYLAKIMPIGLGQAGTIITGNIGYLYLSVAFIQILKSFFSCGFGICVVPGPARENESA